MGLDYVAQDFMQRGILSEEEESAA
jgi:hypothetical protein